MATQLTNTAAQTVLPNAQVIYNSKVNGGCCCNSSEYWRTNSGAVWLKCPGRYEVSFSANIGGTVVGPVALAIQIGGVTLQETIMESNTAAAGDLNSVSTSTVIDYCGFGGSGITVVNVGTTDATDTTVNVSNPNLIVRRIGC